MAWSIVGVGATVESTVTTITLTLPGGYTGASGDLIVAAFSWRTGSAASPTKPSGWNIGVEELNSSTATNNTAMPSGAVHYIVRGGSNPALQWTFSSVGVNLGKIVVYRGNDTSAPKTADNGGQTEASGTTNVNLPGLTTTTANELIFAAFCGGQEGTFNTIDATDPGTNSGGTPDPTTAPTAGSWFIRGRTETATGTDTALAVCDGVRATAGATGNITAITGIAARHVVCAVAFKLSGNVEEGDGAASGTGSSSVVGAKTAAADGNAAGAGASSVVGAKVAAATAAATAVGNAIGEGETFDFLEPDGDITLGGWTDQASGVVNIYQAIDEVVTNDADFVQSPAVTGTATDFRVRLYKNAVLIVGWNHNNIGTSFNEVEQTLSGAEVAAIGTFEDLFIEFDDNAGAIYRFALADAGYTVDEPVTVTYRYHKLVT